MKKQKSSISTDSSNEYEGGDAKPESPKGNEEQETVMAATDQKALQMTNVKHNQVSGSSDAKDEIHAALSTYTRAEVSKHNTKDDCWLIFKNGVYDVTKYVPLHPGGESNVTSFAGLDSSVAFDQVGHSEFAYGQMKKYQIGNVLKDEFVDPSEMAVIDNEPKWNHEATLTKKVQVSKDSAIFTYKFKETFELDLKPGQHITFIADINGEQVMRPYTPIECRPS